MTLRRQSRPSRRRTRAMIEKDFCARLGRKIARNKANDAARWRTRIELNCFWAGCGPACRRAHACRAADPRACFDRCWSRLGENERTFRRHFMAAYARVRDFNEALNEAVGLARGRGAAGGAVSPFETRELHSRSAG